MSAAFSVLAQHRASPRSTFVNGLCLITPVLIYSMCMLHSNKLHVKGRKFTVWNKQLWNLSALPWRLCTILSLHFGFSPPGNSDIVQFDQSSRDDLKLILLAPKRALDTAGCRLTSYPMKLLVSDMIRCG